MTRGVLSLVSTIAVTLVMVACSSATEENGSESSHAEDGGPMRGETGALPNDEDAASAEPEPPDATAPPSLGPVRFKIEIDYRYDKAGFFTDPIRRKALDGACRIWGRLISDSFANVPKGTYIKVRNPEKPNEPAVGLTIDYEIDDLLIFVGSADLAPGTTGISSPTAGLSNVTDPTLAETLQQRFNGTPFQPWTAWISFDTTTDFHFDPDPELAHPVPAGKLDFVSVALHEIGHTLGFGTSEAFKSKLVGATFTGAKAKTLFGGPLPLTPDLGHVPNGTLSNGHRMLMDVSDGTATRYLPTPLDQAVLEDLGLHF